MHRKVIDPCMMIIHKVYITGVYGQKQQNRRVMGDVLIGGKHGTVGRHGDFSVVRH